MPRIGWVCRAARLVARDQPLTLESLSRYLGTNPTRLHRLETGQSFSWDLVLGYEKELALVPGSLQAPVLIGLRSRECHERDASVAPPAIDVREMSELSERLLANADAGRQNSGTDWLRWGRVLRHPRAVGLPESLALRLVDALTSELARSVGSGFACRYEALSSLREGPYGYVVLAVARTRVGEPHVQVLADMISAVTEVNHGGVVPWCVEMLTDPREQVAVGGSYGLENLLAMHRPSIDLAALAGSLVTTYNEIEGAPVMSDRVSSLLRQLPPEVVAGADTQLAHPLQPELFPQERSRSGSSRAWWACDDHAWHFAQERGLRQQTMLTRMIFDAAFSPFEVVSVPSFHLLSAVPRIRQWAVEAIAEVIDGISVPRWRANAAGRLAGARLGHFPAAATPWWTSDDPRMRTAALMLAGQGSHPPPADAVRRALADEGASAQALYAVAMSTGADSLPRYLCGDPVDPAIEPALAWWRREGGVVRD